MSHSRLTSFKDVMILAKISYIEFLIPAFLLNVITISNLSIYTKYEKWHRTLDIAAVAVYLRTKPMFKTVTARHNLVFSAMKNEIAVITL